MVIDAIEMHQHILFLISAAGEVESFVTLSLVLLIKNDGDAVSEKDRGGVLISAQQRC